MSRGGYYMSKKQLRQWAMDHLREYIDEAMAPKLHEAIKNDKLGHVAYGLLKILLEKGAVEPLDKSGLSRAVSTAEIGEVLHVNRRSIQEARCRINKLVIDGAAEGTFTRNFGLIFYNQWGHVIEPGLNDVAAAKLLSEKQLQAVGASHRQNIAIADEAGGIQEADRDLMEKFSKLSPQQRRALMRSVGSGG